MDSKMKILEGRSPCVSFHLDAHRHSLLLKEASLNKHLKELRTSEEILYWEWADNRNHLLFRNSHFFDKIKYALLKQLVLKYLHLRHPTMTYIQRDVLVFLVAALLSSFCENENNDFEPESLWKIMPSNSISYCYATIKNAWKEYRFRNSDMPNINDVRRSDITNMNYICLFGEFLYFTSTLSTNSESLVAKIRKEATECECLLLDEIAVTISPKLGILTYIAFRNCAATLEYGRTGSVYVLFDNTHKDVLPSIHNSFKTLVKKVRQIPVLSDYFSLLQNYICTKISQCNQLFADDLSVLDVDCLNLLEVNSTFNLFCGLSNLESLVVILRDVADIFLKLHSQFGDFNFKTFKHLPEYLENYSMPVNLDKGETEIFKENDTYYCMNSVIIALSLLLDFYVIENWQSDTINDYVTICNEIKDILDAKYDEISVFAREAALFPFI